MLMVIKSCNTPVVSKYDKIFLPEVELAKHYYRFYKRAEVMQTILPLNTAARKEYVILKNFNLEWYPHNHLWCFIF